MHGILAIEFAAESRPSNSAKSYCVSADLRLRKLQKLGVIQYRCGEITVLDRPRLEELCCECYAVVKTESDRLLSLHAQHTRN